MKPYKRKRLITFREETDAVNRIAWVAKSRTSNMLRNLALINYDLESLVVSAYLQGIEDMATVAFNQGYVPLGCTSPAEEPNYLGESI